MNNKVLWIEDDSLGDLSEQLGPIYVDGTFNIVVARSATEGFQYLLESQFEAVIVDIRLPPGEDEQWVKIYNKSKIEKKTARLGLVILAEALKRGADKTQKDHEWIRPSVFGVFTVEPINHVSKELEELGINLELYRHKSKRPPPTTLLELFQAVVTYARSKKGE